MSLICFCDTPRVLHCVLDLNQKERYGVEGKAKRDLSEA